LAVIGFHFHNQATRMTLKRFLSIKRPFSTWKLIFLFRYLYYWPFSLTTVLYLSLSGVSFLSQQNLIRTYLWTLVQNCGLARFSGVDLALIGCGLARFSGVDLALKRWTLGGLFCNFFAHF